jgi:hypothetical protein
MKWIINPTLVNKMRGTEFSIIRLKTEYFDMCNNNIGDFKHRYCGVFKLDREDVSHIISYKSHIRYLDDAAFKVDTPFLKYHNSGDASIGGILRSCDHVDLITFDSDPLNADNIKAYLLFVQREKGEDEDMVNVDTPNETQFDIPDTRIRGLIQSKITYSFDVSKLTIGHPYRIRFLGDIDIFDKHYKYNDEIYGILAEATEEDLKFATIHDNVTNIGSSISSAFQLKPDMKFELDKLV